MSSYVLVSLVLLFSYVSGESISVDGSLLIDCGSSTNTSIAKRWLFQADVKTPKSIFVATNSTSLSTSYYSKLHETARVFNETSSYTFRIANRGRHWIRLHISPFFDRVFDLNEAEFSVSAQNITLIKHFKSENVTTVKEFCLNVTSSSLVLTFTPFPDSFAFVNAIEIVALPSGLFPVSVKLLGSHETQRTLSNRTLETVLRINMGNESVSPENDRLSRSWEPDSSFLKTPKIKFASKVEDVEFGDWPSEDIAPREVYGTATFLDLEWNEYFANVSWKFDVESRFEYLLRFHFCNVVIESSTNYLFNAYIDSMFVSSYGIQPGQTPDHFGFPFFFDAVVKVGDSDSIMISVGPNSFVNSHVPAYLNGLEIMKISDSEDSLKEIDGIIPRKSSKTKLIVIVCLSGGVFAVGAFFIAALLLMCLRKQRNLAAVGHSKVDVVTASITGTAEIAYRFPLSAIREATSNFSEELVIGVGGFGKVYKGIIGGENQTVAIKRGNSHSNQGLLEFRTEIEMLSQFRHRHLVSFIGYCDEQGEMIIIYEYMENGTLKEHLYGSDFPSLSWRQRLQICIGSARGLHYLHTGTAKPIIHRDVKSANILLDENFMAKVADFGLSKAGPEIDKTHVSTAVKGSFGYLDPEYLIMQQLTEKSDVYSFGVVMLEVLCGRAVIDPSRPRDKVNLIDWAMKCQKSGQLSEIVDSCLAGQVKPECFVKFWEIAEKCVAERGVSRPAMGDVLWNLECVLQLQGVERTTVLASQASRASDRSETVEISSVNLGDLAGVSMSKVFARMVREDMREDNELKEK